MHMSCPHLCKSLIIAGFQSTLPIIAVVYGMLTTVAGTHYIRNDNRINTSSK